MDEHDRLKAFPSVTVGSTYGRHDQAGAEDVTHYQKYFHKPVTLWVVKVAEGRRAESCWSEVSDRFQTPLSDIRSRHCLARNSHF